jgi:DNA-binding CsgD family transcriptional regulator
MNDQPEDQVRDGNGRYLATLSTAERRATAAALRSRGKTYRQIAADMGIDVKEAFGYVKAAMADVVRESAEAAIEFELDRLDMAHRKAVEVLARKHITVSNGRVVELDGQPLQDDGPVLAAIDRIVKVSESRRKLLGLDQPAKTQISGGVTYEVVGIDPESLR